jgi:phytoene dehydrogenase-like protein
VDTREGVLRAPLVYANVLPSGLSDLLGAPVDPGLQRKVEGGYGAAMMYLQIERDAVGPEPFHVDLCADPGRPWLDGNHVFLSVSGADEGRAPGGRRVVVASTHLTMPAGAEAVRDVQARMGETIERLAPELWAAQVDRFTASPRTFARFTRRAGGWVGGIPRRAGLGAYLSLLPRAVGPGLHLVGDSVGLGQSTVAAFVTGRRIAAATAGVPVPRRAEPRATPSGGRAYATGDRARRPG